MNGNKKKIATIIGNNVKKCRKERKMKQKEVAEKAGIERSTYARIELGDYIPRIITIMNVAHALDVKLEHLLEGIE